MRFIPPSVSSKLEIGRISSKFAQSHPEIFNNMKNLYKNLPKKRVEKTANSEGFLLWYREKYIETSSPMPLIHFLGVMVPLGYYLTYFKGGHYHPRYEFH